MADNFLNGARTAELWAAIKTALAGKADLSALDGYTTPDAVATAITSALSTTRPPQRSSPLSPPLWRTT